jgi:DNA polymerase-1
MSDKKLFLLDGHALVYRAHYAFITRPLINSKGVNTSAMTGFVRTLLDILKNQKPSHIAVAFDPSGPTFRNVRYEPYKANREEQPEDITIALPIIRDIVRAFNIPIIEVPGYEADDAIGTIAKQAEKEGFEVYMVTPDKDYAQLVSDKIFMYKPSRQGNGVDILGEKEVLESWEIERVDQVIDILGLQGDAVDNIPGIPGIGPKTAVKLLKEFGSVEGVIANADKLKGKQKENVETFAQQALLSKELATIYLEVPLSFDATTYEVEPVNKEELSKIFKELEFRSLAKEVLGEEDQPMPSSGQMSLFENYAPTPVSLSETVVSPPVTIAAHSVAENNIHSVDHKYHLVNSAESIDLLIKELQKASKICIDTETTDVNSNNCELVGISIAIRPKEAYYVPMPSEEEAVQQLLSKFKPILEDSSKLLIGQNIKFDALVFRWYGIKLHPYVFDTMVAHYLLEPELRHNMDYLAETYLKYQPVSITELIGKKGKNQGSMRDVPLEQIKDYAAEDADITFQLYEYFEPKLVEAGLDKLYWEVEAPLIQVLTEIEYNGIKIDRDYLESYSEELDKLIKKAEKDIYEKSGTRFNIGSPKQVGELLFDVMKIPYSGAKTKTGQYSTDEEKLSELAVEFPIVADILNYRALTKLKSTYVDALPLLINPKTGRIHSSFNQALAATGRLSSNNPNLQNIPIKTAEGRRVREAFVPRDDNHVIVAADYSQIELRLIAEMSGEEAMLEAFKSGNDIHASTAAKVYGVPLEEVTSDQRRNAKTVNFSIIYGAGATNLSKQLNIKRQEAKELIDQYFSQYKGLKNYMDQTVEFARKNGYVETILGRKRHLRDIHSKNNMARSSAERMAINTPVQGSAADLIKIAMIQIQNKLTSLSLKSKMVLQVHDELVFDAYIPELDQIKAIAKEEMSNAISSLGVPIKVEIGVGDNWLQAH